MITVNNLVFGYDNQVVLQNLSFEVEPGDYLGIIGPNGVGKSTLIKCLIGINKVGHNQIQIDGKCISCFKDYQQIGYVAQLHPNNLELPITPREVFNLINNNSTKQQEIIKLLNLSSIINIPIKNLSGGQVQRINIAKALLNNVKYLILDEPTSGLDTASRSLLHDLLIKINKLGVSIIVVSHYLEEYNADATAILDMHTNTFTRKNNA